MSLSAPVVRSRTNGSLQTRKQHAELPQLPQGMIGASASENFGGVFNVRDATVLSKADWDGIQYRLRKREIEAERIRQIQEEKQKLHEISLERAKNWSNTVYGQRQKKLEERRIRLENEEDERKKLDVEEAIIQAEKRKSAIEKAKMQQYYQTDRVKAFHSAYLLTEVMKEREAQIELKKLKESNLANHDKSYLEKLRHDLEESKRIEEENKFSVRQEKFKTAEFQKAQKQERERLAEKQRQENIIEAERLKRLALDYAEEERKKKMWRHEMGLLKAEDSRRQIEDIALMKQLDKMQEEEEEEESRLFAAAKRKMMRLRAEKEQALREEKQEQLELIRGKLQKQIEQKLSNEEELIKAAVAEKDAKKAKEEAEKAAKRAKMLESIKDHRLREANRMEELKAAEKIASIEMQNRLKEAAMIYSANEVEKLRVRKEVAKEFSTIHVQQAEQRRACDRVRSEQANEHNNRNLEQDEINDAQFQEYARDLIEHSEKRGRNVYPLRKVAAQAVPGRAAIQRSDYLVQDLTGAQLPSFQTCATDATKQSINGKDETPKRLGFVW